MNLRFAQRLGVSLDELARASGVPFEQLASGEPLSYDAGMALWSALEELTRDPCVGLSAGRQLTIDQMGALGPAFAAAPSLRAGIERLVTLLGLVIDGADLGLAREGDLEGLEYRMPRVEVAHGVDAMFASIVNLARQCTAHHVAPRVVDLQAPWTAHAEVHARFYGVRPRWSQPSCRLLFGPGALDRPLVGVDPALSQVLMTNAERLLRPSAAPDARHADLERAILAAVDAGRASIDEVARRMGTSARTLQRRLAAGRRSFATLRAEIVLRRARELLRDPRLSIDQVAARSGYATRGGFERAFVRWTGQTPAAFRADARGATEHGSGQPRGRQDSPVRDTSESAGAAEASSGATLGQRA